MSPHESIIVDWIVGVELCHMKPKYCALCQHVIFFNGGWGWGGSCLCDGAHGWLLWWNCVKSFIFLPCVGTRSLWEQRRPSVRASVDVGTAAAKHWTLKCLKSLKQSFLTADSLSTTVQVSWSFADADAVSPEEISDLDLLFDAEISILTVNILGD